MRRYAAVLRVPHVAPLIAATLLARFPIGINALAIVLYLRAERGSFAVAGAVREADVERAPRLVHRVVVLLMHRKGEDSRIPFEDERRAVTVMHVEINDGGS